MREWPVHALLPGLVVALVTLLAALPWGMQSEGRFLLPLLPLIAIHHYAARYPAAMPEWLVFLSGLATDVLTHGPLGFWSFIYIVGYLLSRLVRLHDRWGAIGQWLEFAGVLAILAVLQWLIASAYFLGGVDWRPLSRGTMLALVLYAATIAVMALFERRNVAIDDRRFERGA